MAKYKIGGHAFEWGPITFGQFERLVPVLPRFEDLAAQAVAKGGGSAGLGLIMPVAIEIFQILAGDEVDVRKLPLDMAALLPAINGVLTESGLRRQGAAPPGESKAGAANRPRKKTARRSAAA